MEKDEFKDIPKNYRKFYLAEGQNLEDYGFTKEYVESVLNLEANFPDNENLEDPDVQNNLGCIYDDGLLVEPNVKKAVYWFEKAAAQGDDLAKSNLADILRKGKGGYPKDLKRAFELYKSCGLPYAHYRVGEFYEHGWGVEQNLDEAKRYYRLAYKEGHGLAKKKLKEFDFLH